MLPGEKSPGHKGDKIRKKGKWNKTCWFDFYIFTGQQNNITRKIVCYFNTPFFWENINLLITYLAFSLICPLFVIM